MAGLKITHLNCATMCPHGQRLLEGRGGLVAESRIVAHCLLIESDDGLVLVDTGFGTRDISGESGIPAISRRMLNPVFKREETAVEQIRAMGHDPGDVRHVVVTHLDLDHAGGLSDFPAAKVHIHRPELDFALSSDIRAKVRYIRGQLDHDPDWQPHDVDGDDWFGFEKVNPLPGLGDEVAMVPLLGHSAGHAGVAVRTGDGWLLHAGDAFFHRDEIATPPGSTPGWRLFQNFNNHDRKARLRNQERLRQLNRNQDEVRIVCSHDPVMFDAS